MRVRLKCLLYCRDQGRVHEKGKMSGYTLTTLHPHPRPAQHYLERSPLSRWFLQWEKRPEVIASLQALWVTSWEPQNSDFAEEGSQGNLRD